MYWFLSRESNQEFPGVISERQTDSVLVVLPGLLHVFEKDYTVALPQEIIVIYVDVASSKLEKLDY